MKQNQISDLPNLSFELYENIFNIYKNENGAYFYNILQTIVFPDNLPASFFSIYNVTHGDTWPYISFKLYNTPNMWWLLMLANKINNPLEQPRAGDSIAAPRLEIAKSILTEIRKQY